MRLLSFLFSKSEQPITLLGSTPSHSTEELKAAFRRMNAEAMARTDKERAQNARQLAKLHEMRK